MQRETPCGNGPVAAPDHIARGLPRCLACGHENKSGEESCAACGSSLYLKLCGACEAVNGGGATHCHSCGAELGVAADAGKPAEAALAVPANAGR